MNEQIAQTPLVTDPRRRLFLFLLLMMSMFMATLDNQIVSAALPTIIGEFGHLERFGWIGSSYLLTLSAVMPVYGKLGDLFGRKYVMMAAIIIFTVGSAICGLAVSMNTLIAARVLQGLGGGGIMVSIFAVNADLFEPRERAKYQSFSSLVLVASSTVGPVLGGFMSDLFGWRSIFLINLPIGVVVIIGLAIMLPYRKPHRRPQIDYLGAVLLALTTTSIVFSADSAEIFGSHLAPQSLAVMAFAILCATAWVLVERKAPEPIVPLSLFRNSTFSLFLLITAISGGVGIGMLNYISLFLQTTSGLSPSATGALFIPITVGIVCGSLFSGRMISKTGRYKPYSVASLSLNTFGLMLMSQFHAGTPIPLIAAVLLLHGIGLGLAQQVPIIGVQNVAAQRDVGAATGAVTLARMAGASIAISVYGAIVGAHLAKVMSSVPGVTSLDQLTPKMIATLPEAAREAAAAAYATSFTPMFLTAAIMTFVAVIASLMLKSVQLPRAGEHGKASPAEKTGE